MALAALRQALCLLGNFAFGEKLCRAGSWHGGALATLCFIETLTFGYKLLIYIIPNLLIYSFIPGLFQDLAQKGQQLAAGGRQAGGMPPLGRQAGRLADRTM